MSDEITPNNQMPQTEPISEPVEAVIPTEPEITEPEPTAQIPVSEPLPTPTESSSEIETKPIAETIQTEIQSEPVSETIPELIPQITPEPAEEVKPEIQKSVSEPIQTESKPTEQVPEAKVEQKVEEVNPEPKQETKSVPVIISTRSKARELLVKARTAIQSRKRKKLDKVMSLFEKQTKITNDEVEKFLHVSDATATRYLSQLEKEGKIKQNGKTGKFVFYSKI